MPRQNPLCTLTLSPLCGTSIPPSKKHKNVWLQVIELDSRALLQHFRTRKGVAYASTSADGGETWSTPVRTSRGNPNSKMHTLRAEPGLLIAAYNHHPRLRSPLVLAKSRDDGANWQTFAVVEPGKGTLQYSYPTMLGRTPGGSSSFRTSGGGGEHLFTVYSVMHSSRGSLTCFGLKVARIPLSGIPR